MYRRIVQRVFSAAYLQESGTLLEGLFADSGHFQQVVALGKFAQFGSFLDQSLGHAQLQPADIPQ